MSICETYCIKKAKPLPDCLVQSRYESFPLVLLYVILPCLAVLSCSFQKRKRRESGFGGEGRWGGELEEVERGEILVGMCCMREKSAFNTKNEGELFILLCT